jgi:hypothetical protein
MLPRSSHHPTKRARTNGAFILSLVWRGTRRGGDGSLRLLGRILLCSFRLRSRIAQVHDLIQQVEPERRSQRNRNDGEEPT